MLTPPTYIIAYTHNACTIHIAQKIYAAGIIFLYNITPCKYGAGIVQCIHKVETHPQAARAESLAQSVTPYPCEPEVLPVNIQEDE